MKRLIVHFSLDFGHELSEQHAIVARLLWLLRTPDADLSLRLLLLLSRLRGLLVLLHLPLFGRLMYSLFPCISVFEVPTKVWFALS